MTGSLSPGDRAQSWTLWQLEVLGHGTRERATQRGSSAPSLGPPGHVVIPSPKIKDERILEAATEKETVTYKGVPIRLSADFSKRDLAGRRGWKEAFEVMKGKDLHPR